MRLGARDVVVKEDFHLRLGELPIDSGGALSRVRIMWQNAEHSENELRTMKARSRAARLIARPAVDMAGEDCRAREYALRLMATSSRIPDFSNRVTRMEFESEDAATVFTGTHVAGTHAFASAYRMSAERG